MNTILKVAKTVEWPTVLVLALVYGSFAALTWFAAELPWWAVLLPGSYLVCLHGSLQHEAIHGHPTRHAGVNEALTFPSLGLWVPYRRYRRLHLLHHATEKLTDPFDDPESFYLDPARWHRLAQPIRLLLVFNNTLLGRLTIGPAIAAIRYWSSELRAICAGDQDAFKEWLWHVPAVGLLLAWVIGVCGMALSTYVLLFAWPGCSLLLLRSFAEHRAHREFAARTAVVEAHPLFALLFLNNNLHVAHHDRPRLAWYELPRYYRENRDRLLAANRNYRIDGYAALARSFLLRPKEPVPHPLLTETPARR